MVRGVLLSFSFFPSFLPFFLSSFLPLPGFFIVTVSFSFFFSHWVVEHAHLVLGGDREQRVLREADALARRRAVHQIIAPMHDKDTSWGQTKPADRFFWRQICKNKIFSVTLGRLCMTTSDRTCARFLHFFVRKVCADCASLPCTRWRGPV